MLIPRSQLLQLIYHSTGSAQEIPVAVYLKFYKSTNSDKGIYIYIYRYVPIPRYSGKQVSK